jgi:murein DD-endopeptidase MepM/ murein hydrolase activator NlpD
MRKTNNFIIFVICFLLLQFFSINFSYAVIHIPSQNAIPIWPIAGQPKVNSNFGVYTVPGSFIFHDHIDIYAPAGTPVRAVVDGTIYRGVVPDVTLQGVDGNYYTYTILRNIKITADTKF